MSSSSIPSLNIGRPSTPTLYRQEDYQAEGETSNTGAGKGKGKGVDTDYGQSSGTDELDTFLAAQYLKDRAKIKGQILEVQRDGNDNKVENANKEGRPVEALFETDTTDGGEGFAQVLKRSRSLRKTDQTVIREIKKLNENVVGLSQVINAKNSKPEETTCLIGEGPSNYQTMSTSSQSQQVEAFTQTQGVNFDDLLFYLTNNTSPSDVSEEVVKTLVDNFYFFIKYLLKNENARKDLPKEAITVLLNHLSDSAKIILEESEKILYDGGKIGNIGAKMLIFFFFPMSIIPFIIMERVSDQTLLHYIGLWILTAVVGFTAAIIGANMDSRGQTMRKQAILEESLKRSIPQNRESVSVEDLV